MGKIILTTESDEIVLSSQEDLICLAVKEHEEDLKVNNDSFDDLPENYPRFISSYNQALKYLQEYYEGRYLNIQTIPFNKYEIISDEDEQFISSNDYEEVKNKFLSYIRSTQQEYLNNGDKEESEVNDLIFSFKSLFEDDIAHFNEALTDYGFQELIVHD